MTTSEPNRRWFRLSPDRFVLSLLLGVCLLWLSDRFQWFGFNHHKGWTVLISVAAVGVAALVMLFWWAAGLIFRWRFQFGIRSLLSFCLACSIAVSWLAVEMQRARRQKEVAEAIRSSGGRADYDWQVDADNNPISNPESPEPRWLRTMLGDDFSSAVVEALCNDATITAAGMANLKGLTQLRVLGLGNTQVTDAGLEHLKELTQLQWLNLSGTNVSDAGLEHLKEMTQLRKLYLYGTKITDAGLEHLAGLARLRELWLNDTTITDAGLEHLKGLNQLQGLCLSGNKITDAGLEHLKDLTQLRELNLTGTKITDAGVERLQHSLPNCKIRH